MRGGLCILACLLVAGIDARLAASAERGVADRAVERGLAYLKGAQKPQGDWDGNSAVTSLAVMAFLSAGHVPGEGPDGETVEKGIRWVLSTQKPNGLIATDGAWEMYHHGIATLMLAEVAGMPADGRLTQEVRRALVRAVTVILKAQRRTGPHRGGWRYHVEGDDGDISVTGWQLLALRAAKNLGCDVPAESIDRAIEYIKRCYDRSSGAFRYHPRGVVTVPCTGSCILGLELCGKEQHRTAESLRGGNYILEYPPQLGHGHFYYGVYYCAQATFQLGGKHWTTYRPILHRTLLRHQNRDGSWEREVSPAYCTAMAVLALTVEYRFLPIYQSGEDSDQPADK
jgi:hypothetical protein